MRSILSLMIVSLMLSSQSYASEVSAIAFKPIAPFSMDEIEKNDLLWSLENASYLDFTLNMNLKYDNADLIYDKDDRYEVDNYNDQDFTEKARSVAMRVSKRRLITDGNDSALYNFQAKKLNQQIPQLCETERFIDQLSLGDCSAFLVAPNKLVTAGHCMLSQNDCNHFKWVFDYKENTQQIKKSDVYSCKKIISQKYVYSNSEVNDYAVIELDRKVSERAPLKYRKLGIVQKETPLVAIGHPLGLPMKIIDGGRVTRMNEQEREAPIKSFFQRANYFTANLDVYAGNSGSPVFNQETGKVEGIIIQGAEDFVFNFETQCLQSRRLSNDHLNSYEKVMRINRVPGL